MLIEFSVRNFRSLKEKNTLSLEASNDEWLETENVTTCADHRLLKSAALYGANASGKTNFLAAMQFFREFTIGSSRGQSGEPINVRTHAVSTETEQSPTSFEAIFIHEEVRYRYGFEVTTETVASEELFVQRDSQRETRLFSRKGQSFEVGSNFREGKGLEQRTRPNALFLSVCAQFNGSESQKVIEWFKKFRFISGLDDAFYINFTAQRLKERAWHDRIVDFARRADLGLEDVKVHDVSQEEFVRTLPAAIPKELRQLVVSSAGQNFQIRSYHKKFNADNIPIGTVEFDFNDSESAGTQKIVSLGGPLLHTLAAGSVLVVDELEARLHPLLVRGIVNLFNSSANNKNAQLIFATHDEGILESKHLRRDQAWFIEKNRYGASTLYPLNDFAVRKGAKFAREYLLGSFGGVPRVNFENVLCEGGPVSVKKSKRSS